MLDRVYHPEAQKELAAAVAWYSERDLEIAGRFLTADEQRVEWICEFPKASPLFDRTHRFRTVDGFPYVIYYRLRPGYVHLIAVAHEKREPGYWRGR